MKVIEKIKEIIFKIKDYDRLEHDYCYCLCYFTNNRMSKPNYKLKTVETVITDSIGEYVDEGYNEATRKAIEWLEENIDNYLYINRDWNAPQIKSNFIEDLRKAMEE